MISITWSDWREIHKAADHKGCAVYRIRLCNQKTPVRISRFLEVDNDGLLCIGKTTGMESRRKQFVNALVGKGAHSEGYLLRLLEQESSLSAAYPGREYQYSFAKVARGQEDETEEELIKAYVKQFGEVPPLNSAIPNRLGDW